MKKITFLSFLLSFVFATQANAQLNEGFDTAGLPTGWTETASSTYNWVIGATANNNSTVSPRSGAGMALFSAATYAGPTSRLETPSQDLTSLTSPMLTFYYTQVDWGGDQDELSVYYKDSATGTWTLISSYTSSVSSWTKVELSLPNPSADYYIGFEGLSGWGYGITLDDVSIGEAPSCTAPGSLALSNSDSSSADITWVSSETAFNVEYGLAEFTQGSGTSDTSTTTAYTLTGLSSNTSYDVYVQTDCTADGSGTSEWVGPLTITTPPSCGDTVNHCYDAGTYKIFDVTADITGDYVTVSINAGDTEADYDDLVIYDTADNTGNVLYSADGDHSGQSATSTTGIISVWIQGDFGYNCTDGLGGPYTPLSMDITCTSPPACEAPTGITVSDVTTDGATIAWTSDGTLFNIEYGPAGFTQGNGTSDTSATASYELTGLNSGSTYDVYVQTDCGVTDGTSVWSSTSVSTLVTNDSCDTATVVDELPYVSNGDASSATNNNGFVADCGFGMNDGVWYTFTPTVGGTLDLVLTTAWDSEIAVYSGSCGVFTCVDYQDDPEPQTISISVVAGTQYWVNIGSYAGSSDFSEGPYEFRATSTDASLGIEEASMAQFTYFPNPVNDVLTIKAQKAVEDITVFNMLGQVVKQQTPNTMDCTVDLSAMQSGAYFVQVSIGNNVETVRVLKK